MCSETNKRSIILVLIFISLVFAGCSSSSSENTSETPYGPSPSPTTTEKEHVVIETSSPQKFSLQDSAAPLSQGTVDKVFIISHQGQKEFSADEIVIKIYQHGELVDSLEYDTYSKRFQGENLRSLPFSDGKLDYGDDVIITEMSGFNIESDSVLTVKVAQIEEDQNLLYGQIRVI